MDMQLALYTVQYTESFLHKRIVLFKQIQNNLLENINIQLYKQQLRQWHWSVMGKQKRLVS